MMRNHNGQAPIVAITIEGERLIFNLNDEESVKEVQIMLDTFEVDGIYGPRTQEALQKHGAIELSILKSVYCNYRGYLIVYDVHGRKVHELSGEITYEKYKEIEKRSLDGITEFEGLDDYRCIACELKKKETEKEYEQGWDNEHDPFGLPIKEKSYSANPQPIQNNTTYADCDDYTDYFEFYVNQINNPPQT